MRSVTILLALTAVAADYRQQPPSESSPTNFASRPSSAEPRRWSGGQTVKLHQEALDRDLQSQYRQAAAGVIPDTKIQRVGYERQGEGSGTRPQYQRELVRPVVAASTPEATYRDPRGPLESEPSAAQQVGTVPEYVAPLLPDDDVFTGYGDPEPAPTAPYDATQNRPFASPNSADRQRRPVDYRSPGTYEPIQIEKPTITAPANGAPANGAPANGAPTPRRNYGVTPRASNVNQRPVRPAESRIEVPTVRPTTGPVPRTHYTAANPSLEGPATDATKVEVNLPPTDRVVAASPNDAYSTRSSPPVNYGPTPTVVGSEPPRSGTYFLTLLALFASVGMNLYLGWIAWDTYNRYQDLVADMRSSSSRRDRSDRDSERAYNGDRRLADSSAF